MLTALKALIVRMMGTAFKAIIAKTVLIFMLRLYAKGTETRVDDKAVDVLEALINNNVEGARTSIKRLSETWLNERRDRVG